MENTIKPGIRVKYSTLYKTLVALLLLMASIFAILYVLNQNPFKTVTTPFDGDAQPQYSHMIYGGFGDDQLAKPMAVTTIGDKVFVSDTNKYRIQVFTKEGTPLSMIGEQGTGKGQFQFPYGLTADSKGRLMVADLYNRNISIFGEDGKFIEYFGEKQGIDKVLRAPSDIEYVNDKLYVADVEKSRVFVFDKNGKLLQELGKDKEMYSPNGVTVNKENGNVYVVDTGNARGLVYDKTGKLLGQFNGSPGNNGQAQLTNPRGIGIDSKGRIFVVSNLSHLIYAFDDKFAVSFTFGGLGDSITQFTLPNGLHIDEENNIYITDTVNNRVAVYQ